MIRLNKSLTLLMKTRNWFGSHVGKNLFCLMAVCTLDLEQLSHKCEPFFKGKSLNDRMERSAQLFEVHFIHIKLRTWIRSSQRPLPTLGSIFTPLMPHDLVIADCESNVV